MLPKFFTLLVSVLWMCACTTVATHNEELTWDEITTSSGQNVIRTIQPDILPVAPTVNSYLLPGNIKSNNRLAALTLSRAIEDPILYHKGVLGRIGSAKMFVSTRDKIEDMDRLYWTMVRVLSEKYSCFISQKQNREDGSVWVRCRDRRQIVLWPSMGMDWIQFYARQFDFEGYEIKVEKKRIVRISSLPELSKLH